MDCSGIVSAGADTVTSDTTHHYIMFVVARVDRPQIKEIWEYGCGKSTRDDICTSQSNPVLPATKRSSAKVGDLVMDEVELSVCPPVQSDTDERPSKGLKRPAIWTKTPASWFLLAESHFRLMMS